MHTIIPVLLLIINLMAGCAILDLDKNSSLPKYRHYDIERPEMYAESSAKPGSTITLQWDAPKTNTNGTPIYDLAGYEVYYGESGSYNPVPVDSKGKTGIVINNLSPGNWCFAVKTYNTGRKPSIYSKEVCTDLK